MPNLITTPSSPTANSYATLAEAQTYHDGHLYASAWTTAVQGTKETALIMATRLLDATWSWYGRRTSNDQRLEWPRDGVLKEAGTGSWDVFSAFVPRYLPNDAIPEKLKEATAEYARQLISSDRTADLDQALQGISSLAAGSVSLSFKDTFYLQPVPDAVYYLVPPIWGYLRTKGSTGVRMLERA
jgi:hypothetical protein